MDRAFNLLTIAANYPSEHSPQRGAFVHVLMRDMNSEGVAPTVIAPEKIVSRSSLGIPRRLAPKSETREGVDVRRPRYLPLSSRSLPFGVSTFRWTVSNFSRSALKYAMTFEVRANLCYGHFLYPAGLTAQRLSRRLGLPSVVALGEGTFAPYESHFGFEHVKTLINDFDGIAAASEAIKQRCISRYGVATEKIGVFPNAAASRFHPRPRTEMREKLGLPLDRPIVAFVGHFDRNKGSQRVMEAIRDRPEIAAFFLGSGDLTPTGPQVLYAGLVPHAQIPEWLSAADVFVQPVFIEASSNSMKEAMACGLPIVSSDIATNREFLDESMAALVDPSDIRQIRDAIADLIDDPGKRDSMGRSALEASDQFRSVDRARKMLRWFDQITGA